MERYSVDDVSVSLPGHATAVIRYGSKVIYIDPYVLPEKPDRADMILITHGHYDHLSPETIERISDDDTSVLAPWSCEDKVDEAALLVGSNDNVELDDVKVQAVPAYNIGKDFHPKGKGVGYVLDLDGFKIYHAGDTDRIPEIKDLKDRELDIAFLPVGGTFTMDIDAASDAVADMMPKAVIPMHYGTVEGTVADIDRFRELVKEKAPGVKVVELI